MSAKETKIQDSQEYNDLKKLEERRTSIKNSKHDEMKGQWSSGEKPRSLRRS